MARPTTCTKAASVGCSRGHAFQRQGNGKMKRAKASIGRGEAHPVFGWTGETAVSRLDGEVRKEALALGKTARGAKFWRGRDGLVRGTVQRRSWLPSPSSTGLGPGRTGRGYGGFMRRPLRCALLCARRPSEREERERAWDKDNGPWLWPPRCGGPV